MTKIKKIKSHDIGVIPAYFQGKEDYGFCFFLSHSSPVVGCQCLKCNTIVWVDDFKNKITSEKKPDNVPESGIEYRKYYEDKINRLLKSIPNCPSCNNRSYEFINNVSIPKFQNGYVLSSEDQPFLKWDENSDMEVWILDGD